MKIGFYHFEKIYNKDNLLFKNVNATIGDDLLYPFIFFKKYAESLGHSVSTICDTNEKYDAVIFIEFPGLKDKYFKSLLASGFKNIYLLNIECKVIKPDNWDVNNYKYFKKVFTWGDDIINGNKIIKLNMSYGDHRVPEGIAATKEKLCTVISSNKFKSHPQELYSERVKAIRWFEKNHPEEFDLYGAGWDKFIFRLPVLSKLNSLLWTSPVKASFPSYKGKVANKHDVLKKYKFSLAFENASGIPGYITEKIFDCFFAGCVPVYLGAPNITSHIPEGTFVDMRKFKDYSELYKYISTMSDSDFNAYLVNINNFLTGEKFYQFSADYFAKTIIDNINSSYEHD